MNLESKQAITCGSLEEQYKDLQQKAEAFKKTVLRDGMTEETRAMRKDIDILAEKIRSDMEVYKKHYISPEKAIEIMGEENVIGPEDIQKTFNFTSENIPPIPFSQAELTRAKELGQQLILYVNERDGEDFTLENIIEAVGNKASDGKPILYEEEDIQNLQDTSLRSGWRLTSPEITKNTTDKNYLEQTESLIAYLQDEIFKDQDLPEVYQKAIEEFKNKKEDIQDLMQSDWQKAAQQLSKLSINQRLRENIPEAIYRLILSERKNNTKNLENTYTWTTSIRSDGRLVRVGSFDSLGLGLAGWTPGRSLGWLGVCLSRSAS